MGLVKLYPSCERRRKLSLSSHPPAKTPAASTSVLLVHGKGGSCTTKDLPCSTQDFSYSFNGDLSFIIFSSRLYINFEGLKWRITIDVATTTPFCRNFKSNNPACTQSISAVIIVLMICRQRTSSTSSFEI